MNTIGQDLRYAVRSLAKSPGFATVAILSLALGLGVVTTAFTYIDAIRLRALPYPDAGRLVALGDEPSTEYGLPDARYTSFQAWAHESRALEAIAATLGTLRTLTVGSSREMVGGAGVSSGYFGLLGVPLVAGRAFGPGDDRIGAPAVALISERLWRSKFGADLSALGKPLSLDDARPTIIGVVSASFHAPVGTPGFWLPLAPLAQEQQEQYARAVAAGTKSGAFTVSVRVMGRLAPGRSRAEAQSELAAATPPDSAGRSRAYVSPLRSALLRGRSYDLLLGGVALSVLLIACANLGGLLLVRQVARQREFAVRTALGAAPGRIARQVFTESSLLATVAGGLGALLAVWGVQALQASVAMGLSGLPTGLEAQLGARVFAFLALMTLVCAAAVSMIPARRVARGDVQRLLRESALGATRSAGRSRTQQAFVVAQLASASLLLGGAGIIVATYLEVSRLDLGFDPRPLLQVAIIPRANPMASATGAEMDALAQPVLARVRSVPGVKAVGMWGIPTLQLTLSALTPVLPVVGETSLGVRPIARGADHVLASDTGLFSAAGIPLRTGRTFNAEDAAGSPPVAIVDEYTAARWWPGESALGKRVRVGGDREPWVTIVGVVGSTRGIFRDGFLQDQRATVLFRPWAQSAVYRYAFFYVRSLAGDATPLMAPLRRSLQQLLAGDAPDVGRAIRSYEQALASIRANMLGMLILAGSGLVLALIGVYGMVAYAVTQRTQEIGIRMALGAQRADVLRLVLASSIVMAVTGLGIGVFGTLALRKVIRAALFDASASSSPVGIAVAAVAFLLAVMLASYLPARRATRVDPVIALRTG